MRTVQLLERIAALDTRGASVCDAAMVDLLAQLPQHIPALLEVLEKARDASASLETRCCPWGSTCRLQTRLRAARWQTAYPLPFMPSGVDGEPLNPNRH